MAAASLPEGSVNELLLQTAEGELLEGADLGSHHKKTVDRGP